MNFIKIATLAALMAVASVAPAYARMHCYFINGKQTCCTTLGNYTTCT